MLWVGPLRPLCEWFLGRGAWGGPWQRQPACPVLRKLEEALSLRSRLALPPQIPRSYLVLQEAVLAEQQRRSLSDDAVPDGPAAGAAGGPDARQRYPRLRSAVRWAGSEGGRGRRAPGLGLMPAGTAMAGSWGGVFRLFTALCTAANNGQRLQLSIWGGKSILTRKQICTDGMCMNEVRCDVGFLRTCEEAADCCKGPPVLGAS